MSTKKDEKRKKSKDSYGKNSTHSGYDGCTPASGCGPNFEIVLNIKERKKSEKKEEEEKEEE
ncbi:MAG: hypothetical protein WED07_13430 [Candidatus Freyarchaeum deiterrae]